MSANISLSPIEKAAYQEFEYYGSTLTTNTTLRAVVVVLSVVLAYVVFRYEKLANRVSGQKPLIIRVNGVGQAQAVDYRYSDYTLHPSEARYFLDKFVVNYYSRNHETLNTDYPASLYYLSQQLFNEIDAQDRKTHWAAKFLRSSDDDVDVNVKNIALDDSQKPEYKAVVNFEKVYQSRSGGGITKTEDYTGIIRFRVDPTAAAQSTDMVKNNPLGFSIQYFRADQAFSH